MSVYCICLGEGNMRCQCIVFVLVRVTRGVSVLYLSW